MLNRQLPSLTSLRAFESAARLRSFKKAADELAVTATAVSHRIRVLEAYLDRPLFLRKARAIELTRDGATLFAAVKSGFDAIALGIEQLTNSRRASVTLSATPAFATKWLVPRLAAFQASYPDIDLHVHASNAPVDMNGGTVDLAIRYGLGRYAGAQSTLLLDDRFAPVASPRLGLGADTNADAGQWPLIYFDWHQPLPVDLTWSAWARQSAVPLDERKAGMRYSEESHAIQAAVAGQGVALLSLVLVEEELRLGLLQVLDGPQLQGLSYHLLYPLQRPRSEAAITVERWLLAVAVAANKGAAVDGASTAGF